MDTRGSLNPAFEGKQYLFVFLQHFSKDLVTVPTPKNVHHWIT